MCIVRTAFLIASTALLAVRAAAADAPAGRAINVFLGFAASEANWHGRASLRSASIEWTGIARRQLRRLPATTGGVSLTYSDVVQPRSWFGRKYGEPYNHIRAESAYLFLRHEWRTGASVRPWLDLGSGPMWSNRRIPQATSRFNFHSQLGFGVSLAAGSAHPLYIGYRFSHISNFELAHRNPGWNLLGIVIGMRFAGR